MSEKADIADLNKARYFIGDFSGGMRRDVDPSALKVNEYAIMSNGRSRNGSIVPTKGPRDLTGEIPVSNFGGYQGLYGFDSVLVLFKDGQAFGINYAEVSPRFQVIPDLQMDANISTIYAELVPASWQNIQRKLSDGTDISGAVKLFSQVFGTPAALVVQDGINVPSLIFNIGLSRKAKRFVDWVNTELLEEDTREYVPIGKNMLYKDGRLYITSPDNKEIYRSVTGRPLDFVIAIDTNGDKLVGLSSGREEATRLSYRVGYEPITALYDAASSPREANEDAGFLVGTLKRSTLVYPTFRRTLFAEPTFNNQALFSTGPVNQFSITDILGDTAAITDSGITSFNSILAAKNEGINTPFHKQIHQIFDGIIQTICCAFTSDNYAFFGVNTVYGPGILVYDTLLKRYAAFDIYPEIHGFVKQFAEIKVNGIRHFFCITTGNQLFELFAGNTATCSIYTREFLPQDSESELIPRRVRLIFDNITEAGTLTVTEFVNGKPNTAKTKTITATSSPRTLPISLPFGSADTANKTVTIEQPIRGSKVGLYIQFNFQAELQSVELIAEEDEAQVTDSEQGAIFDEARTL